MSTKRMRTGTSLLIGLAVALSGATLATMTGAASAAPGDKAESKTRRVCRVVSPPGSRLVRRECRSQEEWDAARQKTQDGVFDYQTGQATGMEPDPNMQPIPSPGLRPNRP